MEGCKREIKKVCENCEMYIKLKWNSEKHMLRLQKKMVFNHVVAKDLGELEGKKFLAMIDLATLLQRRLSIRPSQ